MWIKATLIAAGTDIGGMLGGGAGLLTGPASLVASPAGVMTGAAAGAGIGAVAGEMVDHLFFSKRSSDDRGSQFRGGKQSQRDPDHDRLVKEFNPTVHNGSASIERSESRKRAVTWTTKISVAWE